ncbi:MAG: LacI family DNA-binding transcriptional regulator [Butyricicoccus sp.]
MGITLKQIAELAGVHKSTVDKVIHNRPGVSDAKRQQIRKLLDEYGYESNPLAKALNYQKNKMTVAVVMPEVDALPFLKHGMELVHQDFNSFNIEIEYHTMPFSDPKGQAACLRKLGKDGVSGVVLLPIEDPAVEAALVQLHQDNIPVVTVNSDLSNAPRLCFVGQDMEQAGRVAARMAELLLPFGGQLGIVSSRHMRAVKQREQAFQEYLKQHSKEIVVQETVITQESPEDAYQTTMELLERHPQMNALFITCGCVPDICRAMQDAERADQMTVLCYECYPMIKELLQKQTIDCTISGDLGGQGRLAMRMLFEYLIYDRQPQALRVFTKNEILLRENI